MKITVKLTEKIMILILMSVFFYGCSEETNSSATLTTLEELKKDWRYYGFEIFYNEYQPDQAYLDSIADIFDTKRHLFLFYTSPSCYSCGQMDKELPYAVKVIESASLVEGAYELYDTPNIKASHPHEDILKLNNLPSVYVINEGTVYSILDTLQARRNRFIDSLITLEMILYESIR